MNLCIKIKYVDRGVILKLTQDIVTMFIIKKQRGVWRYNL
jgi:hypothetical protein